MKFWAKFWYSFNNELKNQVCLSNLPTSDYDSDGDRAKAELGKLLLVWLKLLYGLAMMLWGVISFIIPGLKTRLVRTTTISTVSGTSDHLSITPDCVSFSPTGCCFVFDPFCINGTICGFGSWQIFKHCAYKFCFENLSINYSCSFDPGEYPDVASAYLGYQSEFLDKRSSFASSATVHPLLAFRIAESPSCCASDYVMHKLHATQSYYDSVNQRWRGTIEGFCFAPWSALRHEGKLQVLRPSSNEEFEIKSDALVGGSLLLVAGVNISVSSVGDLIMAVPRGCYFGYKSCTTAKQPPIDDNSINYPSPDKLTTTELEAIKMSVV